MNTNQYIYILKVEVVLLPPPLPHPSTLFVVFGFVFCVQVGFAIAYLLPAVFYLKIRSHKAFNMRKVRVEHDVSVENTLVSFQRSSRLARVRLALPCNLPLRYEHRPGNSSGVWIQYPSGMSNLGNPY